VVLDARSAPADRRAAFQAMDGLLLSGGADIDPARYGRPNQGSVDLEPDRDSLEAEAYAAAAGRGLPILGVCRGLQAINVFNGGTLLHHVPGHVGPAWGHGPAQEHALRLVPGSRLARILSPTNPRAGATTVNSYHHQAVRASELAPGLVASALAASPEGDLVEGFEAMDGRFVLGVQCHPERTDSTPESFERLWRFFVDACRGPAAGRT
jgi:putative glutamine amidotransferase